MNNNKKILKTVANWVFCDEDRILEVMCKEGNLAQLLSKKGVTGYIGFDTNQQNIQEARIKLPEYKFMCSDILDNFHYFRKMSLVIILDYLQFVRDDLALINNINPGTRLIFSVPNNDCSGSYRCYNIKGWKERYNHMLDFNNEIVFKNPYNESERTFLYKAERTDYIDKKTWKTWRHVSFDFMTRQAKGI